MTLRKWARCRLCGKFRRCYDCGGDWFCGKCDKKPPVPFKVISLKELTTLFDNFEKRQKKRAKALAKLEEFVAILDEYLASNQPSKP